MAKKDLSLNKVGELCEKIKGENGVTFEELKINNPSLSDNPIIPVRRYIEKCPSHERPDPTWSDKLGEYPELKESDVIDIYVFINGMPWQRK